MTKEQEDAIKFLELHTNFMGKLDKGRCIRIPEENFTKTKESIKTVLNMLKEKDADIAEYKNIIEAGIINAAKDELVEEKNKEIEKKDKMIDLMAEHICNSAIVDDTVCAIKCDCETDINEDCTYEKMLNCTKQYFERKAEEN